MAGLLVGAMIAGSTGARAENPVVARSAELTSRVVDSGTGALRIAKASVRQDRLRDRVHATVVLDGVPDAATAATLVVAFGPIEEGQCQLNDFSDANQYASPTFGSPAEGWSRNGRTFRLDLSDEAAGFQPWECAGAILVVGGENLSFLGGNLKDHYMKPKLRIGKPKILERTVKGKLRLVRGTAHTIRVQVNSRNQADAYRTVITGRGRGLKVGRVREGLFYGESERSIRLVVRPVARRVGPLVLRVSSRNGGTVRRKVPVRLVRPPARPRPGAYRSADGDITFRITAGKRARVKGFRIHTRTRCGGYGEFPTYTWNYYNFPGRAIGGGGVLDGNQRTRLYSVSLGLKAIGRRVTEGRFSYGVFAAPCSAFESFSARRVGR